MRYILSEENYNTNLPFKFKEREIYKFNNWYTDGVSLIDSSKVDLTDLVLFKELNETQFNSALAKFIKKENLQRVLNNRYEVTFSDVAIKNWALAETQKTDTLIDSFYLNHISPYEVFYNNDKFYLFYLNEACEDMGINFDSYMFIGLIAGIDIDDRTNFLFPVSTLDYLRRIKKLNRYYNEVLK